MSPAYQPVIRAATTADAERLSELAWRLFDETFVSDGFRVPYPAEDLAAFREESYGVAATRRRLENPAHWWEIAELNGQPAAYSEVGPASMPHPDLRPEHRELKRLYVGREAQGHGIGTQLPSEVWMALDRRAWRPKLAYPPLRIFRYSGAAMSAGIETHRIEGRPVKVYGPAKTVADCFKYRNKIGLDVALEALRACLQEQRATVRQIDHYAKICRVSKVIRPYLEAI